MATKAIIIELVTEFAKELKNKNLHLRKVILFGSYARDEQHQYSDIDVAIVADEFIGFGFKDKDYFADIKVKKTYLPIEAHTFSTEYFEKGDPFIDEIKRTGIEIF